MRFYHNFNILIERYQEAQKTLDRELPEVAAQHLGDIGLFNTKRISGFGLFQTAVFLCRSYTPTVP
jgi:hypothetical protein